MQPIVSLAIGFSAKYPTYIHGPKLPFKWWNKNEPDFLFI